MALPASGNPLGIGQIRAELQNTADINYSLAKAGGYVDAGYVPMNQSSTSKPNLVTPYAISEWYSYDHAASVGCSSTFAVGPELSTGRVYHRFSVEGTIGQIVTVTFGRYNNNTTYSSTIQTYLTYPFESDGTISILPYITAVGGTVDGTTSFQIVLFQAYIEFHFVIYRTAPFNPEP